MTADELASSELRKWREEEERRHIEENVMLTSASEKPLNPLSPPRETTPKPVEKPAEKPAEEEPPKEPAVVNDKDSEEREKAIAALLEAIPSVTSTPAKKVKEEEKKEEAKKEEVKEEEIKEEKEKGGNVMEGFAMRELKMEKGSDSAIAVAMPEGSPIFFTANVIACPDDKEVAAMDVDSVMRVIGRMTVDTCQTFLESRRDHSGYDVFWWTLELDAKSTE